MSICLITGDHPRHAYLARRLYDTGLLVGWVKEQREAFVPSPAPELDAKLATLFEHHFAERERVETTFFGSDLSAIGVPTLEVSREELNSQGTRSLLTQARPCIVISYGCHKLSSSLMASIPAVFWNTHGGLSPEYRGVTTHFWPSYFLEPQMTGVTLHETTNQLDGGAIILQTSAPMVRGDTLHMLAARNLVHYAEILSAHLAELDFETIPSGLPQKTYGRVFMERDWRPEHLSLIYETYNDQIVDAYLDGKIKGREPQLVNQFTGQIEGRHS